MAETVTTACEACVRTTAWDPWSPYSFDSFDRERPTEEKQQAMVASAPEALAYFFGLDPGRRVDGGG